MSGRERTKLQNAIQVASNSPEAIGGAKLAVT